MSSPIIVALDFACAEAARQFVSQISPQDCRLKIGKGMFTLLGPDFVREVQQRGFDVFLDLKFHDIPNTVASAVKVAADLGVWMVDIHASGGIRMMEAAKTALLPYGKTAPLLMAVTVLTSMNDQDLTEIGLSSTPEAHALKLATLAQQSGMDGVVCSAQEVPQLRTHLNHDFQLVTPGIRPIESDIGDQRRVMTPEQAMMVGVDYLVIGRPITQAVDPAGCLQQILATLRTKNILE